MEQYKICRQLYGYNIEANVTVMDRDIHILLTGGCLPHVGAVSIFKKGKKENSIQLPGHKDGVVGGRWARQLSEKFPYRVTVVCGIHYDNASAGMIEEIVRKTDEMYCEVIKNLEQNRKVL